MNYTFSYVMTMALFIVIIKLCPAQKSDSLFVESIKMSREQSYITIMGGVGNIEPLYFEAALNPYYMLHFDERGFGLELSAKVIVRMYQEYSCPIRTPSYMPRITGYINTAKTVKSITNTLFFSWCHHSNGQDGPFFYANDSTIVNTISGDFTTNMIEVGVYTMKRGFSLQGYTNSLKLSAEFHYRQSNQLYGQYGNLRFNGELRTKWSSQRPTSRLHHFEKMRCSVYTQVKIQWIAGNLTGVSAYDKNRLVGSLLVAFRPSIFDEISFFGQYYYGQDYYNIYFSRILSILRVGILATISS